MPKRGPALAGILLGAATAAAYMIGSGRSFGYDAAASFANFIATPSLLDAFVVHTVLPTIPLKDIATNDHVLLSLVSHVIYSATGTRSEVVYRTLPALAAGATVAVAATALARRFGMLAGVIAALYIATDPLFVDNSRDLRGYSLAALCVVLATVVLAAGPPWTRLRLFAYGLLMGLAIAAHVFAAVVLVGHVAWIAVRPARGVGGITSHETKAAAGPSRPELIKVAPAWLLAVLIGGTANVNIVLFEVVQHGLPPALFDPTFPRDLVLFLLGAPVLLPVGLWLSAALLGLWTVRAERWVWASIVVIVLVVAVLWLGVRPAYLYPRFFIYLIPGIAYLMAAAIARWKVLAPVVLVGAVVAAVSQIPGYTDDPLALPQATAAIERVDAAGGRACVIHWDEMVLAAYTTRFTVVTGADQLSSCDAVVVVSWNVDLSLRDLAAQQFPKRTVLRAGYPAVVLEKGSSG